MSIESYVHFITQTPAPFLFLIFVIMCEYAVSIVQKKKYSFSHVFSNFGVLFIGVTIFSLFNHFVLPKQEVFDFTLRYSIFPIHVSWTLFFVWIIVFDFINYWTHILYHKSSFFWMFHAVHHSDQHLEASTAIRVPIIASFSGVTAAVFLAIFGLNINLFTALAQTIFLQQILVHSFLLRNMIPSFVSYIFITPNMHILHHTEKYGNKNYGFLFSVWDRIFRTGQFQKYNNETFGVISTTGTKNPFLIHKEPVIQFFKSRRA